MYCINRKFVAFSNIQPIPLQYATFCINRSFCHLLNSVPSQTHPHPLREFFPCALLHSFLLIRHSLLLLVSYLFCFNVLLSAICPTCILLFHQLIFPFCFALVFPLHSSPPFLFDSLPLPQNYQTQYALALLPPLLSSASLIVPPSNIRQAIQISYLQPAPSPSSPPRRQLP